MQTALAAERAVEILGVRVTSGSPEVIVDTIDRSIAARTPLRVAFLNANLANVASTDRETRDALSSFLVLNDGAGVNLARKVLHGEGFAHNLNGTDFVPRLLDETSHELRLYLLGSQPPVLNKACRVIRDRWPRHTIVGATDGYRPKEEQQSVAASIRSAQPDVVLVAMGNPVQEKWIADYVPDTCPCGVGVGAWFDFVTDTQRRAPDWMRKLGLEWLFRLTLEPRRLWRRYIIGNVAFVARVIRQRSLRFGDRKKERITSYPNSIIKRSIDLAGSATLLVLLSPILVGIALAVRVSSPGPVLYRQVRNGRHQKPFEILKFRTMHYNSAEDASCVAQATRLDERVTQVGRFLRRTSLDELPQFYNVLRGDMSLVGPRPHALSHDDAFARKVSAYSKRFRVKPGISGLAQVNGARGPTPDSASVERRLKYDLTYVRSASASVDMAIIARTVAEVLDSKSAY